jgi:hypothetical protein
MTDHHFHTHANRPEKRDISAGGSLHCPEKLDIWAGASGDRPEERDTRRTAEKQVGGRFAVAITCIDGRFHEPAAGWLRRHSGADFVDLVTEPGADLVLADHEHPGRCQIAERLRVSLSAHHPSVIAVVGHADCAANPADACTHQRQIAGAVDEVRSWNVGIPVLGLWVDPAGLVQPID